MTARLDDRVGELDTRTTKSEEGLKEDLQARSDVLATAIQESHQQAVEILNQGLQELRDNKIDSKALSGFLVDLAGQLETKGAGSR